MIEKRRIYGFSLITAVFMLVVLGVLMGYIVNLRVLQQTTVLMSVQGTRALQAARSGLEYGMYRALIDNSCPASVVLPLGSLAALTSFSVTVECASSLHDEGAGPFPVYTLTSLAELGAFESGPTNANPNYVSRRLRVTVSNSPP